jgi:predicted dehydrogenase
VAVVRIGVLGAASVAPYALLKPSRANPSVEIVAVAARDIRRAEAFAVKHAIARVHRRYEDLVSDPEIDAVYNPLPTGLHGRWTLAAIKAGKHVLCEKPFTANAAEARVVAAAAAASGLVVAEAFHSVYHPMWQRIEDVVFSGQLGEVQRIDAAFSFPLPFINNFRRDYHLGGGALMDVGCYPVGFVCRLAAGEPEVLAARAKLFSHEVDRAMTAELRYPNGATGQIVASMWSVSRPRLRVHVKGSEGELRAYNPVSPQGMNRLVIRDASGRRHTERAVRHPSSYACQLDAFVGSILRGDPVRTSPQHAVRTLSVIDAIYRAAGLSPRQPTDPTVSPS